MILTGILLNELVSLSHERGIGVAIGAGELTMSTGLYTGFQEIKFLLLNAKDIIKKSGSHYSSRLDSK